MTPPDPGGDWRTAAEAQGVSRLLLDRPPGLLLAAHRFTLARQHAHAESAYAALLHIEPNHRAALLNLVNLLLVQGRQADAAPYRRRLVELEVDALGLPPGERADALAFRLAVARLGPPPDRVPAAYVARSFDTYAPGYDAHLTDTLHYRGPALVLEAVRRVVGDRAGALDVADLGCGTGLAAPGLRPLARRLDGVDLSPVMLEKARGRGLYDGLEVGDIAEFARLHPAAYDLILALEVLNYLGDLAPTFAAVAGALRPGGVLVLTAESGTAGPYALAANGRYTHTLDYLRAGSAAAGLSEVSAEPVSFREEMDRPVAAHLLVLRREGP